MENKGDILKIHSILNSKGTELVLSIENDTEKNVFYYDDFSGYKGAVVPSFHYWIMLEKRSNGEIITSQSAPDGWWTANYMKSDATILPVRLSSIKPKERIEVDIPIEKLYTGLLFSNKNKVMNPVEVMKKYKLFFKFRIYFDSELKTYQEYETEIK
jgi:hypothetical protein